MSGIIGRSATEVEHLKRHRQLLWESACDVNNNMRQRLTVAGWVVNADTHTLEPPGDRVDASLCVLETTADKSGERALVDAGIATEIKMLTSKKSRERFA